MTNEHDPLMEGELQLKDLDFVETEKEKFESLPAALCDDLLLAEIKSIPDISRLRLY